MNLFKFQKNGYGPNQVYPILAMQMVYFCASRIRRAVQHIFEASI